MRGPSPAWLVVGAFVALSAVAVVGVAHADSARAPLTANAVAGVQMESVPAGTVQAPPVRTGPGVPSDPLPGSDTAAVTRGVTALVDPAWVSRAATLTGIPPRALAAYGAASLTLAAEQPGCRLGWTTLAAIGSIESDHGRHGGSALGEDGTARPPILGVALDGEGFAAIADSDAGTLDGDAAWDRAVGPFQFIPETWQQWGADGDGDGRADAQDIDDAAVAAGRYLCSYGDLAAPAAWRTALFAYNHDDTYVDAIAASANALAGLAG